MKNINQQAVDNNISIAENHGFLTADGSNFYKTDGGILYEFTANEGYSEDAYRYSFAASMVVKDKHGNHTFFKTPRLVFSLLTEATFDKYYTVFMVSFVNDMKDSANNTKPAIEE